MNNEKLERIKSMERSLVWFCLGTLGVVVVAFIAEYLIPGDNALYVIAILAGPLFFGGLLLLFISWIREMYTRKSVERKDILIGGIIAILIILGYFT